MAVEVSVDCPGQEYEVFGYVVNGNDPIDGVLVDEADSVG